MNYQALYEHAKLQCPLGYEPLLISPRLRDDLPCIEAFAEMLREQRPWLNREHRLYDPDYYAAICEWAKDNAIE